MSDWTIVLYNDSLEKEWDEFVEKESCNGVFLHKRHFLKYHNPEKFKDHSLMFYYKNQLMAVFPANSTAENGQTILISHQGSTYGSFVYSKNALRIELAEGLLDEFEKHIAENCFQNVILKPTPDIMCNEPDDVFRFLLEKRGYKSLQELNLYIDLDNMPEELQMDFSKLKKRQLKKCMEAGLEYREVHARDEIVAFHKVLSENLKKYDRIPVHSVEDIMDLMRRFPDEIKVCCVFKGEKIVAGTMIFEFQKAKCVHTQYLAALRSEESLSPMTLVYYSVMQEYKQKGFRSVSWGIATDHEGEVNYSLMRNKEEFGSRHAINQVIEKKYN